MLTKSVACSFRHNVLLLFQVYAVAGRSLFTALFGFNSLVLS